MSRYTGVILHVAAMGIVAIALLAGYYGLWPVGAVCFLAMGTVLAMAIRLDQVYALPAKPAELGALCSELVTGHQFDFPRASKTKLYVETPEAYIPLSGGFLATINREDAIVLTMGVQ